MNCRRNENTSSCLENSNMEIQRLLGQLREFRKGAPDIICASYEWMHRDFWECLKQIKINLQDDLKRLDNFDETFAKTIKIPSVSSKQIETP